mgnify:CR=1 FL=1
MIFTNKRVWIVIVGLLLISPIFGVYIANLIGYKEPLDIIAEKAGLRDLSEEINWTPLYDYSVPGLNPLIGYIVAGLIGLLVIVAIGFILMRLVEAKKH